MTDLLLVTADQDAEFTVKALLKRHLKQFGIGDFTWEVIRNIGRDSGCRTDSVELLRDQIKRYRYTIVLFDFEGCEPPNNASKEAVAAKVEQDLSRNGWQDRCRAILIDPELENWIWTRHDRMARSIGWKGKDDLYTWLEGKGLIGANGVKPPRPKESFAAAIDVTNIELSASLFEEIAEGAPLGSCTDPAFKALVEQLAEWFPLKASKHG